MKQIPLIEQQVLAVCYNNIDLLDSEYNQYFISDIGSALFKGLSIVQEKRLTPSLRTILLHSLKYKADLTTGHLEFLKEEYVESDLLKYVNELKDYKTIHNLQNEKLDDLTVEISKKEVNLDLLEEKLEGMLHDISKIKSEDSEEIEFLSRKEETERFQDIIEERKLGISYPSGDSYLDSYLYNRSLMPQEITILFGPSGSGKSTFNRNLIERRTLKNLPTLDIQLEMSLESSLDAKLAIRTGLSREDFSFSSKDDEEDFLDAKSDRVEKALEKENSRSRQFNKYFQLNLDSLSISGLKQLILKAKKKMGLKPTDYILVAVDLLTQIKDFNVIGSKASNYEDAMNSLHALCKELNIHLIGLVQPKRPDGKVSINTIDDIEKLRPNTEMLKNSGSLEERARVIISVFRKMHFIKKYIPDDPSKDYLDDVMEVQILKQNNYDISPMMYYMFKPDTGILYEYKDYDPNLAMTDEEDEE